MAATKKYTIGETKDILKNNNYFVLKKLIIIEKGFDAGQFKYLSEQIKIANKRIDDLQNQIRTISKTGFGSTEVFGFFLAPILGNLLVQPLVQNFMNKFFGGINLHVIGQRVYTKSKKLKFSDSYLKSLGETAKNAANANYDFTGPDAKNALQSLYGKITPDALGGAFNDASQAALNLAAEYAKHLAASETTLSNPADEIYSLLVDTGTKMELMKKAIENGYSIVSETLDKLDEQTVIELSFINDFLSIVEIWNGEQIDLEKTLSDHDFGLAVLKIVSNFLVLSFLGNTNLGDVYLIGATYEYERPVGVPKALIDHLITNLPDYNNSYIATVARERFPAYDATNIEKVITDSINDTDYNEVGFLPEDETYVSMADYERRKIPISLYDNAAYLLLRRLPAMRAEMLVMSNNIFTNLSALASSTKK